MLGNRCLYIILSLLLFHTAFSQPNNIPLNHDYQKSVDQNYIDDVFQITKTNISDTLIINGHRAMRPMMKGNIVGYDRAFEATLRKTTFGKKLFNESLFIIDQPGFFLTIDPVFRFEGGEDLASDSLYGRLLWNTRGVMIRGNIGEKLAFGSEFYENQARLPLYQSAYVRSRGELYPNSSFTDYVRQNAVIPGMGRTKPFKESAYDFAYSAGYLSYTPFKSLNIQFGHGQHFIGSGYRSLLLSDNSFNYPYLRFTSNIWKNKIQYTNIYAAMLNLYRLPVFSTSEATYEKKSGTFHYLSFNLHPKIQFGIFEGIVWERYDSAQIVPFDYRILNPIILTNTLMLGQSNFANNRVSGITFSLLPLKKTEIYGQFMLNNLDVKRRGIQFGVKHFDVFNIANLFLQIEYNSISTYSYGATNAQRSYSHFNLPLAHPAGSGFTELALHLDYEFERIFVRWQYHLIQKPLDSDPAFNNGTDIFTPTTLPKNPDVNDGHINYLLGEIGYRFNKTTRFEFYTGVILREEIYESLYQKTAYFMVGLRTRMRNQYFDF